ncbi:RICIN domain-containing protein [Kitasatospora sp. NPDC051853]|uniref:RICIN domain-containing protein n=1 Tax=Kitasatospora sp. NPDC051853 TaxID=3364058 RepID=UPI0037A3F8DF
MTRLRIGLGIAAGLSSLSIAMVGGTTAEAAVAPAPPVVGSSAPSGLAATQYRTTALTSGYNNRCLDADLNTINYNGTKVQLWDCNGWSNQTWIWTPVSGQPVGYYWIQTEKNYKCLDADLGTIGGNGTKVQLWDCNGWDNQIWIWDGQTLQTKKNARVLDADLNTIQYNGTKVQLWDRNGWSNQRWIWH